MTAAEGEYVEFVPLTAHPHYEIATTYPYVIRNRSSGRVLAEYISSNGYALVSIDSMTMPVHRVVAEQFITADIQGMDVNHINHNRLDNRVENLEVITHSENLRKRKRYTKQPSEYISLDDINQEDLVRVDRYKDSWFSKYYFDKGTERVYIYQEKHRRYKVVRPTRNGKYCIISLTPTNKPTLTSEYDKFLHYGKTL